MTLAGTGSAKASLTLRELSGRKERAHRKSGHRVSSREKLPRCPFPFFHMAAVCRELKDMSAAAVVRRASGRFFLNLNKLEGKDVSEQRGGNRKRKAAALDALTAAVVKAFNPGALVTVRRHSGAEGRPWCCAVAFIRFSKERFGGFLRQRLDASQMASELSRPIRNKPFFIGI